MNEKGELKGKLQHTGRIRKIENENSEERDLIS